MAFISNLVHEENLQNTEKGGVGFLTTGSPLVDFNFTLPSFRDARYKVKSIIFRIAKEKDPYLLKYLFYMRDCRAGIGERKTFRLAITESLKYVKDGEKVISLIPEYGRWDDLLVLEGTEFENVAFDFIKDQLFKDIEGMKEGKPISLLAKWMPSDNASRKRSRFLAHKLARHFGMTIKEYRAFLVSLRKYLDILEVKTCSNKWGEIDYGKVSSNANLRYRAAFFKHDRNRRKKYLEALSKGEEEAKINSSLIPPYEIVHRYIFNRRRNWSKNDFLEMDNFLEELWKRLPDMPGIGNTLVVRDGSSTMRNQTLPRTRIQAIDVADALSIYASERCFGEFKDSFITFSSHPEFVSLAGLDSLRDKLQETRSHENAVGTNLEAVFDLILTTAVKAKLPQEEFPRQILFISDMEFDAAKASEGGKENLMNLLEVVKQKYEKEGYSLPKLVFWNVNGRTNTIPMKENSFGLTLVSGFSVHIMNMVTNGELDPYKALVSILDVERYKPIPLAEYK